MNNPKPVMYGLLSLVVILVLWLLFGLLAFYLNDPDPNGSGFKSGAFGDSFGAVNALFTGLSIAGLVFTLYLQQQQIKTQSFESNFFTLFNTIQTITINSNGIMLLHDPEVGYERYQKFSSYHYFDKVIEYFKKVCNTPKEYTTQTIPKEFETGTKNFIVIGTREDIEGFYYNKEYTMYIFEDRVLANQNQLFHFIRLVLDLIDYVDKSGDVDK